MTEGRLLLISGSTRAGSTNTAALATARAIAPRGCTTFLYGELAALPVFNPDDDHDPLPTTVVELRRQIGLADGVLFCTPEYAGGLPGGLKNLLDWTVGGGEFYLKPVAWINVSSVASETGGAGAHASLASVLQYVGAIVVPTACKRLPVRRDRIGPDGLVGEGGVRAGIALSITALLDHDSVTGTDSA